MSTGKPERRFVGVFAHTVLQQSVCVKVCVVCVTMLLHRCLQSAPLRAEACPGPGLLPR